MKIFRIIYVIVKFITLPAAITHAFFEHMCCRASKIIVDDARTIQANEMLSHVDHELVRRKGASFDICFIPFLLNLVMGLMALSHGSVMIYYFKRFNDVFAWICLYLGIALLTNLFPQVEDVMMLSENVYKNSKNLFVKIIVAPFYAIFFVGAYLEKFGVTLLTSIAFSFAVPYIFGTFVPAIYNLFQ